MLALQPLRLFSLFVPLTRQQVRDTLGQDEIQVRLDVPAEELVAASLRDAHHLRPGHHVVHLRRVLLLHARRHGPVTGTLDEVTQHVRAPVRSNRARAGHLAVPPMLRVENQVNEPREHRRHLWTKRSPRHPRLDDVRGDVLGRLRHLVPRAHEVRVVGQKRALVQDVHDEVYDARGDRVRGRSEPGGVGGFRRLIWRKRLVGTAGVIDRRRAVLLGFEHEAGVDERREAVVPTDDVRSFVRGTLGTREGGADPSKQLHGAVRRRALPRRVQKPVPVCHRRAQVVALAPGGYERGPGVGRLHHRFGQPVDGDVEERPGSQGEFAHLRHALEMLRHRSRRAQVAAVQRRDGLDRDVQTPFPHLHGRQHHQFQGSEHLPRVVWLAPRVPAALLRALCSLESGAGNLQRGRERRREHQPVPRPLEHGIRGRGYDQSSLVRLIQGLGRDGGQRRGRFVTQRTVLVPSHPTRLLRHLRRDFDARRAERPALHVVHVRGVREQLAREHIRERRLHPTPLRRRVSLTPRSLRRRPQLLRVADRYPALVPHRRGLQLVLHLRPDLVRHDAYVLVVKVRVGGLVLLRPPEGGGRRRVRRLGGRERGGGNRGGDVEGRPRLLEGFGVGGFGWHRGRRIGRGGRFRGLRHRPRPRRGGRQVGHRLPKIEVSRLGRMTERGGRGRGLHDRPGSTPPAVRLRLCLLGLG